MKKKKEEERERQRRDEIANLCKAVEWDGKSALSIRDPGNYRSPQIYRPTRFCDSGELAFLGSL